MFININFWATLKQSLDFEPPKIGFTETFLNNLSKPSEIVQIIFEEPSF